MSDREQLETSRAYGLRKRHETREERFHERVRDVLAEDIADYCADTWMTPSLAASVAASAYQALLDAGYVVIPAAEGALRRLEP